MSNHCGAIAIGRLTFMVDAAQIDEGVAGE
jgi:hypothetical protein